MPILTNRQFNWIVLLVSTSLFAYVVYRTVHLSMTFDEVWTFDLASQPIQDLLFAEKNFTSANHHILNSILIKPCLAIFGHEVWVLRLPNVLSYLLYLMGSFLFVIKASENNWIRLMGFLMFNLQIYVLDFFSLSRGYGLAESFEMLSLGFLVQYISSHKSIYLTGVFGMATLAIFSNFTWLNFFVPLWAVMNMYFILWNWKELRNVFYKVLIRNSIPTLFAILVGLFSFIPIRFLRKQDEFKWGADTWFDSFHTFAKDFNYSNNYAAAILLQIVFVSMVVISVILLFKNIQKEFTESNRYIFILLSLLLIIVLATLVQRLVLNTMYMDGRKAIMYIPICCGLIMALLDYYHANYPKGITIISNILGFYFIIHFFLFQQVKSVREWWFDQQTQYVIDKIIRENESRKASIAMDWHFESSFSYYNRAIYKNQIQPIVVLRNEAIFTDSTDYYYVFKDELKKVPSNYVVESEFDFGAVVLKKQD